MKHATNSSSVFRASKLKLILGTFSIYHHFWMVCKHAGQGSFISVFMAVGLRKSPGILPLFCTGPRFDTQSGHILSFLLPLIQGEQLSITGESMCTKNWLTA